MEWKLADAKNKPSEVVTRAETEGPQTIRRNGTAVVVVAESTYRQLTGETQTLKDLLLNGPSLDGVVLPRDRSPARGAGL